MSRRGRRLGILGVLALAAVLATGSSARADEAAESLRQYTALIDRSTDSGLVYLARAQRQDGSYASAAPMATTSLCVMAFLAKGHRPGMGRYGGTINRAVDFVLRSQRNDGLLCTRTCATGPMYDHAISTVMLAEIAGMVDRERRKKVNAALVRALSMLLHAQKVPKPEDHRGGWRYYANSRDSDLPVTGWCLMALRSARAAGAMVPKEAIDDAKAFVLRCRGKGGFGYWPNSELTVERTGVALLCLELAGRHRDEITRGAGDYILKNFREEGDFIYYRAYYCGQAMFQLGGEYWERFAPRMYRMLLRRQLADGSWPTTGTQAVEALAGPAYATAMSVLSLGVTYRQLPIFQR